MNLTKRRHRSLVVDHLREKFNDDDGVGIACIFCDHKQAAMQTPVNIIADLLRQLLCRGIRSQDTKELYKSHIRRGTRPSLDQLSKMLQSEISTYSKVYVILDGLDECPQDEDSTRARLLEELRALQPNSPRPSCSTPFKTYEFQSAEDTGVNLMVTSRYLDNIAQDLGEAATLEISASANDVRTYINARISRSVQLSKCVNDDEDLRGFITKKIVENPNFEGLYVA